MKSRPPWWRLRRALRRRVIATRESSTRRVVEGQFWLALDGQPEKTLRAGQSFELPDRAIHAEGAIGDKPCKLFVAYVLEKGQPL